MRRFVPHGRRVLLTGAATAAIAATVGGIAYSAIPSGGVIHACYSNRTGTLHVIDTTAGAKCGKAETALAWDQHGTAGPPGPQGATGPRGASGPQGSPGAAGARGPAGLIGPAGAIGPQGPAGPAGAAGPQGLPGLIGAPGLPGPIGPSGAPGADGQQGVTGPAGAAGLQGTQGAKGDSGDTGPAGAKGDTGDTGPTGPQGPPGPTGSGSGAGTDAYAARDPGPTTVTDTAGDVLTTNAMPDGHYIVTAKASFRNASPGSSTALVCVLHGTGAGDVEIDSTTVATSDSSQIVALLGFATFSDTTTVGIRCSTTSSAGVVLKDIKLVAMSVSSLSVNDPGVGF